MHGTRWWKLAALLATLVMVLAACGGDGETAAEAPEGGDDVAAEDTGTDEMATDDAATDDAATDDGATEGGATDAATDGAAAGGGELEGKIAVLLPDSASSDRWETDDRPLFEEAFADLGLSEDDYIIQNAEGDAATQQAQAEQAITQGATVLLLVNLDSGSGSAIIANARSQGVDVIDYDRLTVEGEGADYYVSFNNETVGELQGEGLVQCIEEAGIENPAIAVLNGSPTDNNATLFKNGYDSVINPLFESGEWTEVDDQSVPDWDNQQALTIFEQMYTSAGGEIDGVLAANDGLANAVISALKSRDAAGIPVTGQDATVQGLQHILAGDQCMTVYKAIRAETEAAAELAVQLARGEEPQVEDTVNNGQTDVPAVLLTPVAVTEDNIAETVIADGFRTWEEICVGEFEQYCPEDRE